jgi:flagellar hook protein FlgE
MATLGNAMTVIGDNIANVNTIGFKASRATFQDVLSQSVSTNSGSGQVGRGTTLADISSSYSQGSVETTDNSTDLAIGGDGFFIVRDPDNPDNEFFTRAGQFRFDKDGNLVNTSGQIVRGWALDPVTGGNVGTVTDIVLQTFTSAPQATDKVTVVTNLNSAATDNSNPLEGAWDGQLASPIGATAYEYQSTLKAYDSVGETHDITIYYDPVSAGTWEFIVTCNPAEDNRTGAQASGDDGLGMLARGQIDFNAGTGVISDIDLDEFTHGTDYDIGTAANWTTRTEAADLTSGYFTFAPEFIAGTPMSVQLDFGSYYSTAAAAWANDALSTTQYAAPSATVFLSATGYGAGDLQGIEIATDGGIDGHYTNGQVIPLYRVALARFQSNQGLFKAGKSLFMETRASGPPIINTAGTAGLGEITPNALEQSNVDIATEFVKMITTQRGFQANSKIITVTDQMLAELINLKR